jgi:hypothetical protein
VTTMTASRDSSRTVTAASLRHALACGKPGCPCGAPGTKTHCPSHQDRHPSLDVVGRDGRVLFVCRTGCPQDEVLSALRRLGIWSAGRPEPLLGPEPTVTELALERWRGQPASSPEVRILYAGSDLARRWRHAVESTRAKSTALGDESESGWELRRYAADLERDLAVLEADLDRRALTLASHGRR